MSKITKTFVAVAALVTVAACSQPVEEEVVIVEPIVAEPVDTKF
jgi:hypothetical protein